MSEIVSTFTPRKAVVAFVIEDSKTTHIEYYGKEHT